MRLSALCLAAVLLCACDAHSMSALTGGAATQQSVKVELSPSPSPIQHIVIVIQENRTFNNLFEGYPGATWSDEGLKSNGQVQKLGVLNLQGYSGWDICHALACYQQAYDHGKMDGFNLIKKIGKGIPATISYNYVNHNDTTIYWNLARHYTLADDNFESSGSSSFPAHQYLIAGQSGSQDDPPGRPWGCDFPNKKYNFCFNYETLGDLLDNAGITWRYYSPGTFGSPSTFSNWEAYDAIKHIRYGTDWNPTHISMPETNFFSDVTSGHLQTVSWVVPTFVNSDHLGCGTYCIHYGPNWVASVVDAIGNSSYWSNTAIFIVWDDWGGWYDPIPPPQIDSVGLGFRVPLIVVSPYAKAGHISKVQHDFGSILHFTEERFGLPTLGERDATADDLSDCFNYGQKPIVFKNIPHGAYGTSDPLTPVDSDF